MNSIFIIAHAPLASALRSAVLHVFADAHASVVALDVQPNVSADESLATAKIMLQQLVQTTGCTGCLVLTDVFGATPCNVAARLVTDADNTVISRLIAGANLPMLLRAMTYKHESLSILESRAVAGGIQGVMSVANTAQQHQNRKKYDQNDHDHQQ